MKNWRYGMNDLVVLRTNMNSGKRQGEVAG